METKNPRVSAEDEFALEIVSSSMCSLNFLRNATDAIIDTSLRHEEIGEIYEGWIKRFGANCGTKYIPYSLGAVVGYLYCGILLAREKWFDLLPDDSIENASMDWAFANMTYSCPLCQNPTVKYMFRRLRNAMAHGNVRFCHKQAAGIEKKDKDSFEKNIVFIFHDLNPRNHEDICKATIPLFDLSKAITKFNNVVRDHLLA